MTVVAVVLHCSDCCTERRVVASGVQEARAELRSRGWVCWQLNTRRVDLCPACKAGKPRQT